MRVRGGLFKDGLQFAVFQKRNVPIALHPNTTRGIPHQREQMDGSRRIPRNGQPITHTREFSVLIQKPEMSPEASELMAEIFPLRHDVRIWNIFEDTGIIARQFPRVVANPEDAIAGFVERGDMAAVHFRGVMVIEYSEAHAIAEAHQAAACPLEARGEPSWV